MKRREFIKSLSVAAIAGPALAELTEDTAASNHQRSLDKLITQIDNIRKTSLDHQEMVAVASSSFMAWLRIEPSKRVLWNIDSWVSFSVRDVRISRNPELKVDYELIVYDQKTAMILRPQDNV